MSSWCPLLVVAVAAQAAGSPVVDEELAPEAATTTTAPEPEPPGPLPNLLGAGMDAAASMAGGLAGALSGAACALLVPGACTVAFLSLIAFKEAGSPRNNVPGALQDGVLYALLFYFASIPLVLLCALTGDALGYALPVPVLRRRLDPRVFFPAAVAVLALVPVALVALAGGAVFLTWLGVAALPDVLMVVGLGVMGVAAAAALLGILVLRPLVHLGATAAWLTWRGE